MFLFVLKNIAKDCHIHGLGKDSGWRKIPEMPIPLAEAAYAQVGKVIFVFGGITEPGGTFLKNELFLYRFCRVDSKVQMKKQSLLFSSI